MDYLQRVRPSSFDPPIDRAADMAGPGLATLAIYLLTDLSSPQVIYVWSTYVSKVLSAIGFCQ